MVAAYRRLSIPRTRRLLGAAETADCLSLVAAAANVDLHLNLNWVDESGRD